MKHLLYLLSLCLSFSLFSCSDDDNDPKQLDAPANFKAELVDKQIQLSWDAPKHDSELAYEVYLKEGTEFKLMKETKALSFTYPPTKEGKYTFVVKAKSLTEKDVVSKYSEEKIVTVETKDVKEIDDTKALYTIYQANPGNKLDWAFDVSDPKKIKMTKSTGVTFETIEGKQRVVKLEIGNKNITGLSAIADLTELTFLDCTLSQLSGLDVSKNTKLTRLDCYYNQLTSLDVSNNTKLTTLYCYDNPLTNLDLSKNTELTGLSCWNNQLANLNLSKNTKLEELLCSYNSLTSLDVSKNTELRHLECGNNKFTEKSVKILKKFHDISQAEYDNKANYLRPAKGDAIYNVIQ